MDVMMLDDSLEVRASFRQLFFELRFAQVRVFLLFELIATNDKKSVKIDLDLSESFILLTV